MMVLPDEGVGIFTAVNGEALVGLGDPSSQTRFIRALHETLIERFHPGTWTLAAAEPQAGAGIPTDDVTGTYVLTRVDPDSVMRLEALVTQFEVTKTGGVVVFDGTGYARADTGLYRNGADGVAFSKGADGVVYATRGGTNSYRRAAWWETTAVTIVTVGGSLLLLLGGVATGMYGAPKAIKWLMAFSGMSALASVAVLGYGLSTAEVMEFFTGLPTPIRLAQVASAGALASTLALAVTIVVRVRRRELSTRIRSAGSAVVLAGVALSVWAWVWAVLPF
jgi:hypothetical protein